MEADGTTIQSSDGPTESLNETSHSGSGRSEHSDDSVHEIDVNKLDKRELRAKSARELVQSQERLVDMLQSMKSDLYKMDREATRIKEDIVRSNQYFNVVVKMKQPHHLKYRPEGYNLPHSIPKVIYPRHRTFDREMNMRYLNQLSTYRPNFLDESRRSSLASQPSVFSDGYFDNRMSRESSRPSSRSCSRSGSQSRRSTSSTNSGYSGTESEIDFSRTGSSSDISHDSCGSFEVGGSSTESAQSRNVVNAASLQNRRSSYFYTMRAETPPHAQSDEVEL